MGERVLGHVVGLPYRDLLERFFEENLGAVRAFAGPQVDAYLDRAGLVAAASGDQICLSTGVIAASGSAQA
jgi:hypothetical protein